MWCFIVEQFYLMGNFVITLIYINREWGVPFFMTYLLEPFLVGNSAIYYFLSGVEMLNVL